MSDLTKSFLAFMTLLTFVAALGFLAGVAFTEKQNHDCAIKAGAGAYVVNPKTGETTFRYGVKVGEVKP